MHSGGILAFFGRSLALAFPGLRFFACNSLEFLAFAARICYENRMTDYIVKMNTTDSHFRLNFPKALIIEKGWEKAKYVRLESQWGDRIVIRRILDDGDTEEENS